MIITDIIHLFKEHSDLIGELFSTYNNLNDNIKCKKQILTNLSNLHKEKLKTAINNFIEKYGKNKGNIFQKNKIIHIEKFTLTPNSNYVLFVDGTGFESFGNNGLLNINTSNHNSNNYNSKSSEKKKISLGIKKNSDYENDDLISKNIKYFNVISRCDKLSRSSRNFFKKEKEEEKEGEGILMKNYSGKFGKSGEENKSSENKNKTKSTKTSNNTSTSNTYSNRNNLKDSSISRNRNKSTNVNIKINKTTSNISPNKNNSLNKSFSNNTSKFENKKNVKKIKTSSFINKPNPLKIPKNNNSIHINYTPNRNHLQTEENQHSSFDNLTERSEVSSKNILSNIKYKRLNKSTVNQFINMPDTTTSTSSMDHINYSNKKKIMSQSFDSSINDLTEEIKDETQSNSILNNTATSTCTNKKRNTFKKRWNSSVKVNGNRIEDKKIFKNKKMKNKYSEFINITNKNNIGNKQKKIESKSMNNSRQNTISNFLISLND